VIKKTTASPILKPNDAILLKLLLRRLPNKNFYKPHFIREVKFIAQQIRRVEKRDNSLNPEDKLLNPEQIKSLITKKIRKSASSLNESLNNLPFEGKARIDSIFLSSRESLVEDKWIMQSTGSFTEIIQNMTGLLVDICDTSYKHNTQGHKNPYLSYEKDLAVAYQQSCGTLDPNKSSNFFKTFRLFRKYCQVPQYDPDKVSRTHLNHLINSLS